MVVFEDAAPKFFVLWRLDLAREAADDVRRTLARFERIDPAHHHSDLVRIQRFVRKHRDFVPDASASFYDARNGGFKRAILAAITLRHFEKRWPDDLLLDGVAIETITLLDQRQAGFDVLSRVIEVASGLTYEQFLKQRLFDPLEMKDTGFYPTGDGAARLVTLYARQAGELVRNPNQDTGVSKVYFSGAGGIMTDKPSVLKDVLMQRGQWVV
jgi:hypothetical protein